MRHIITLFLTLIILQGCRDKVICPAFQSTYILDDSVRSVYYSYLWKLDKEERLKYLADHRPAEDTSAVIAGLISNNTDYFAYVEPYVTSPDEVRKSKFGIVKYEPYWLKNYKLRTAPMENVLSPPVIEEEAQVDVGEFVASDFTDSSAVDITEELPLDSTAIVADAERDTSEFELPKIAQPEPPKTKRETTYLYRYDPKDSLLNVEQEYYNWYFGEQLVRVRDVPVNPSSQNAGAQTRSFWLKVKKFFTFSWAFKEKANVTENSTEIVNEVGEIPEDQSVTSDGGEEDESF